MDALHRDRAVAGGLSMIIDPSGKQLHMDTMLPYFQVLPFADVLFQDFLFSGFALLIVNGLTNLTAAVLLLRKKKLGVILGAIFGVTLMLWICIQFYKFELNFMSTACFVLASARPSPDSSLCGYTNRKRKHNKQSVDEGK